MSAGHIKEGPLPCKKGIVVVIAVAAAVVVVIIIVVVTLVALVALDTVIVTGCMQTVNSRSQGQCLAHCKRRVSSKALAEHANAAKLAYSTQLKRKIRQASMDMVAWCAEDIQQGYACGRGPA
eukprot:1142234-Pelagomonas_calceolata.AAC.4